MYGIGYYIIREHLPEKLTTFFWTCFLPLRAVQWKHAFTYFDPDLERFLRGSHQISRAFCCKIFQQCDKLFVARHRDVAVRVLVTLHRELDCLNALQDITSDVVKHMKDMVISRLKILCPILVEARERQRFDDPFMNIVSALIVNHDEELRALLSPAALMMLKLFYLPSQDEYDPLHKELKWKSRIDDNTHRCLGIYASSILFDNGVGLPRQTACYCRYVWEAIKDDFANLFQTTAESLSSLLHAEIETVFTIKRNDTDAIKSETLGEILGRVFEPVQEWNDKRHSPSKVTIFLQAMRYVSELTFLVLPYCYDRQMVALDETQRRRQASTYRHLVLLSLLVQASTLVNEFLQEKTVDPSRRARESFSSWCFESIAAGPSNFVFGAIDILRRSIHETVFESETGIALRELSYAMVIRQLHVLYL